MRFVEILALRDGEVLTEARVWEDGGFEGAPGWMAAIEAALPQAGVHPGGPALLIWMQQQFDRGAIATKTGNRVPRVTRTHLRSK